MRDIVESLKTKGYTIGNALYNQFDLGAQDWKVFNESWNRLPKDKYMNDNGQYRFRRYSVFSRKKHHQVKMERHQPHYQGLIYNSLNGGVNRHYAAFESQVIQNVCFKKLLQFSSDIAKQITNQDDLHIEAHQFRIIGRTDQAGYPAPEGIHNDGRTLVFMMFINKKNVTGGASSIYDINKQCVMNVTLSDTLRYVFLDDRKFYHSVSPIRATNASGLAYRDMLVITFLAHQEINQQNLNDRLAPILCGQ